ncbi:hypothetical protein Pmar_PMAR003365 [Perkinsus marinus ATCC 50983]|uniref:Uncharacterized protein n=1 Tax=Perkinsus marinus (strain ATCC 50983 / TXsc) TaxID=423536 RepID=C5KH46_PERM5|nr:hypothetical protein Pmar_PMAR003365 [Perkinsus marinus ATCC 50983]EER15908.1 hypothetical protein Pmar_PMAR003365 [Perkinsus marinus ATCC 50983]|eukprot:XP_002784112.1 hypothetical protein Pmar_PMAR003365 [Perkinsus marinus ATCC 50983]
MRAKAWRLSDPGLAVSRRLRPLAQYLQCIKEDIVVVKRLVERRRLPLRGLSLAQQCNNDQSDITTAEEHLVFLEGLRDHGRDWTIITSNIPTRTNKQVRSHAQKYFQDLDRRLQDQQDPGRVVQSRLSQSQGLVQQQESNNNSANQAKEQLAIEELLRSLTVAQGTQNLSKHTERVDENSAWNPRPAGATVSTCPHESAGEAVPATAQATMRPAASGAVCPSNLELAALAAVAANLTSKRGVSDVNAHGTAAQPFVQGLDLSAIAAAASAISCAPATPPPPAPQEKASATTRPGSGEQASSSSLQTARDIGLLTGGDVLAMDNHLTFVDNMRSILHHFLSALPPASAAYEEVSACLKDVEAHLHECRAWAPIMTEKLHSTGQQLYARTSMLFDKYMNSNNSSLKGTSPSNNDGIQGQPCHTSNQQFFPVAGESNCPISTECAGWQQTAVVPVASSESPERGPF